VFGSAANAGRATASRSSADFMVFQWVSVLTAGFRLGFSLGIISRCFEHLGRVVLATLRRGLSRDKG
jgi:hypothetical protein